MAIRESYFKRNGRLSRSQFILLFSIYPIGVPILLFVGIGWSLGGPPFGIAVFLIATMALIYSFFTIVAKRLHDHDKRGWWSIVYFVVPLLACGRITIDSVSKSLDQSFPPLFWLGVALASWGFFEVVVLPGTRGANRFGPEPQPLSFGPVRRFFHMD